MHAEYEADQRQEEAQTSDRPCSEPYLDEELEELSGSELETTKQVQYRTLGWESPDEFSDSELLAKEQLEPDIWADDDMSIYEQQPDFSADATYNDLARGGPCSFFEPQFNSAPASPIETEDLFGGYQNPLDDYEDYLGEIELGLRDPPLSWAVEPSQEQYPESDPQIVTAKGPLEPFCQYFNEKLANSSLQYTFEDLTTEINGMLVGVFSDWVLALKDKPRVSPMTINPDGSKVCSHVCEWRKDFDVLECPACHIGKPMYTATCSGCGIERCLCCK